MRQYRAFTVKSGSISSSISVECHVRDSIRGGDPKPYSAILDTGATSSAISHRIVGELGLVPVGKTRSYTAAGELVVDNYQVDIILPGDVAFRSVIVSGNELGDTDMLIGMDIICHGDFSISNYGGKTACSFRVPSKEEIDYVAEIGLCGKYRKIHEAWLRHGNTKCPCLSGKKWEPVTESDSSVSFS